MNVRWFQEPEHVSYVEAETFLPKFAREVKLPSLPGIVEEFRQHPTPEGVNVKTGMRGTSLKLFIPDLTFEERLDMGDTVWIFMGETHVCYCVYWKREE